MLRSGALTHLEWVEACASRLDADGIVLALADFPRTDLEYAAQIKKVATDLGLVPVALDAPGLLDPARSDDERAAAVTLASAVGAALIRTTAGPPGELPPETFARAVVAAKTFTSTARAANVTLAVAAAPGSLLAGVADLQNFSKYVDSAWLRYDMPAISAERALIGPRDRVLVERLPFGDASQALGPRRGWLVVEGDGGDDPFGRAAAAIAAIRSREGQQPQMPSVVPG
jgi:hypothetical protein